MSASSSSLSAPGPGYWEQEGRTGSATTRCLQAIFRPAFERGMASGFARYGILLDTLDVRYVEGHAYVRERPIGAPEGARRRPPRLVFALLRRLHPALRRRLRVAARTFEDQLWRRDRATFRDAVEPEWRARSLARGAIDVAALDDRALREHVQASVTTLAEGFFLHFQQTPASLVPVGDWMVRASSWTGASSARLALALPAGEPLATSADVMLARVAAARAGSAAAQALLLRDARPASERLAELRASPGAPGESLAAYLALFGPRIVSGFDLDARTLDEMPSVILETLAAALGARDRADARATAERVAGELRSAVPAEHRATYDALLAEARIGYGLHDEDLGTLVLWPAGLLRRALLESGARLFARGALAAADHVFELEPAEITALLDGARRPDRAAIERRIARDRGRAPLPASFGERPAELPAEWLPPPAARAFVAVQYCLRLHQRAERARGERVEGHGVSPGRHEGRACIVRTPADYDRLAPGDVLVARLTSPAMNVVLPLAGAVVTDRGGVLCHAAIVAREMGIPAVVGTGDATERIADGARVRVDGEAGIVEVLD